MRPVSQSDLPSFEQCPSLWHATRVRNLDAGNRFSRIGTACHVACEALTRAVLGGDGRALYLVARDAVTAHADAVDLPPDEMHEALDIMDSATAEGSAISFWVPQGWTAAPEVELALGEDFGPLAKCGTCAGLGEIEVTRRGGTPEQQDGVETCKACRGTGWLGVIAYRGRLDRLQWNEATGELEVWDWKTGQDWLSGADVLLDVQARWYAMLALAWFPAAHTVTFRRVMLRLGYTASAKFVRGERWHGQIMDRARRLLTSTNVLLAALTLSPGDVRERFGGWCELCPVRGRCLTYAAAQNRGATLGPNVSREEKARSLRALKAAANELDEQLRADVTAHGPIPLGDGTALGFWPKRAMTLRLPTRGETLAELRQLGMTDSIEAMHFIESERATAGCVRDAIEFIGNVREWSRGERKIVADRLLAPATGFNFEVKETEDA